MEKELQKHNKQLAIPSSNIKIYKELPIAERIFDKDQFLVKIKASFVTDTPPFGSGEGLVKVDLNAPDIEQNEFAVIIHMDTISSQRS